jgi:hypothetical protein
MILKENNLKHKVNTLDHPVLILLAIIGIGFIIRIYFTPFHIPISLDGVGYFAYAFAMSREGTFPTGYIVTNFGWPSFVSIFFTFTQDYEMLTLMNFQRILSIIISVSTAVPIYFLAKIFFKKEVSLLATSLFVFDPRIIENSILGITDGLFILLVVLTIFFIFYKKGSLIYLSFICVSLAAFVRYEGLLLIIPLIISYWLKNKQITFSKFKFTIGIILFLMILIPVNFINYESEQRTSIFSLVQGGGKYVSQLIINDDPNFDEKFYGSNVENKGQIFVENAIVVLITYIGWILIPLFIIFCILGVIFIPKTVTRNKIIFGIFFIFLTTAGIYAYGRGIQDTRYLLVLLPIFSLLCCYGFNYLTKYNIKKITIIVICTVIVSSCVFVEYRNQDNIFESEIYEGTLFLVNNAEGVNTYPGNKYVTVAELQNSWPELPPKGENGKMIFATTKTSIGGFDKPIEYIKFNEDKGLTHIVVIKENEEKFFDDIYINENNYPFLEKIYDSNELEMNTKYKIFMINFERLNDYEKMKK